MHTRRALSALASEPDQARRLRAFRAQNPQVVIGTLGITGAWQATIPQRNGEIVMTRYVLKDLLDKLDEVLAEQERDNASRTETTHELEGC